METSKKKIKALVDEFCSITGESREVGTRLLEACNGNLQLAVNMHMEGGVGDPAQGASGSEDCVRAPIPQTQEILVDDETYATFRGRKRKTRSVFDGFRDFQEEAKGSRRSPRLSKLVKKGQQEEALQSGSSRATRSQKTKTLQDLFRPPLDLTYKGTLANARDTGKTQGKWLMVNIQNVQEFSCQALNRDVWSNSGVKAVIKEHFIFWQVYHDSAEGQKYCQWYKVDRWPYVAVLDPQTGENLVVWSKIEPLTFCDLVTEFLEQMEVRSSPPAKRVRREGILLEKSLYELGRVLLVDQERDPLLDADEDEQLQAAIKASLTDVSKTDKPAATALHNSGSESDISDSDLETFSDSEDDKPRSSTAKSSIKSKSEPSPLKKSKPSSPKPQNSGKFTDTTALEKGSSHSKKSERCRSPLAKSSEQTAKSKTCASPLRNDSTDVRKTTKGKSPLKKQCKKFTKDSSPEKSQSIHNDVHPAVLDNIQRMSESSGLSSESETEGTGDSKNVSSSSAQSSSSTLEDADKSTGSVCTDNTDYKAYLGKETDEMITMMIRMPDGQRDKLSIPNSSKLKAVVLYVGSKGFSHERYELVAHFPRRQLSDLDFDKSLVAAGLLSQETIFVQARS